MHKGQRIGYKRVSHGDQNTVRQLDGQQLDRVYEDKASGKDTNRPALAEMLGFVRDGDTIVVHSMDRFARSVPDLRRMVDELTKRGVRVEFVQEGLTFTGDDSPMSTLILNVLGSVAEFVRAHQREAQREGIEKAKQAGKYGGRQPALKPEQVEELKWLAALGVPSTKLAKRFEVGRTTVWKYLKESA